MDSIKELELWYHRNCDGAWEHRYGVKIDTLDNPGWMVQIDLVGTPLQGVSFEKIEVLRTENDWIVCRLEGDAFQGDGGVFNLKEILDVFHAWRDRSKVGGPSDKEGASRPTSVS